MRLIVTGNERITPLGAEVLVMDTESGSLLNKGFGSQTFWVEGNFSAMKFSLKKLIWRFRLQSMSIGLSLKI